MMKDESREVTFVKNYKNILNLSCRQLVAIKNGDLADLNHLIAQKQLIIDYIKKSQSEIDVGGFQPATVRELRQLISDIAAQEDESWKLLSTCRDTVRGRLVASRQASILRQAYEAPFAAGRIVNRSK